MAEGHMKTMLYGILARAYIKVLETSPRFFCNLIEIKTLGLQTHSFGYKDTK